MSAEGFNPIAVPSRFDPREEHAGRMERVLG